MLNINKKISPYNFSSRNGNSVKYIVLHYTGNKGDTAKNNVDYFYRADRSASAHYFVDDNEIWQSVEESNAAWSVGDGKGAYGITNRNSISVEMCCNSSGIVSDKTESNALDLVKSLMSKYNVSATNVVRHYDASRKSCPNWSSNNWERWSKFKDKLTGNSSSNTSVNNLTPVKVGDKVKVSMSAIRYATGQEIASFVKGSTYTVKEVKSDRVLLQEITSWVYLKDVSLVSSTANNFTPYRVRITCDVLNVRADATTNSKIVTTVKQNEVYTIVGEKNDFLQLKSGAGFIHKDYTVKC